MCNKMGGDIKLTKSQKGMTVFSFKIPVKLTQNPKQDSEGFFSSKSEPNFQEKKLIEKVNQC